MRRLLVAGLALPLVCLLACNGGDQVGGKGPQPPAPPPPPEVTEVPPSEPPESTETPEEPPQETPPPEAASAPPTDLQVVEAVWTDGLEERNPRNTFKGDAPGSTKPLYLWLRVKGGENALDYLSSEGPIPIEVKWVLYSAGRVRIEKIPLTIGSQEVVAKLRTEVQERGYFDWRTWSYKENVRVGRWGAEVESAEVPLLCGAGECEWEIELH